MGMIYNFEDLIIWQEARCLVKAIYLDFAENHDYGFRDQIQRAVVSIMNNIAEGFQKHKNSRDNKVFINYLNIADGSCGEVKSMLYVAEDLQYLSPERVRQLQEDCKGLEIKIESLIKKLNSTPKTTTIVS